MPETLPDGRTTLGELGRKGKYAEIATALEAGGWNPSDRAECATGANSHGIPALSWAAVNGATRRSRCSPSMGSTWPMRPRMA